MASPNFDAIQVQLSRFIGDKVASASTDGNSWTSAQRDNITNYAIREWLDMRLRLLVAKGEEYPLKDYINEGAVALVGSVKTLSSWSGGVVYIIGNPYNVTDSKMVYPIPAGLTGVIANSINNYLTPSATLQYYNVYNGQFQLFGGTATSSIKLRYVQQHTALSSGGSSDILIPSEYWGEIVELATAVAMEDLPTQDRILRGQLKEQKVMKLMGF